MQPQMEQLERGFRLIDRTVVPARNVIVGSESEQHVEPKAMQVLLCLAAAAGDVVSRQQLLSQVWPDTYSGEEALTRCISLLRSALGEAGNQRRFIETVPKTGYRLIAPVKTLTADGTPAPFEEPAVQEGSSPDRTRVFATVGALAVVALVWWLLWLSDAVKPEATPLPGGAPVAVGTHLPMESALPAPRKGSSIAVLAFDDLSASQDQAYMSTGIAEEVLHSLAQIPGLRVIARTSAFSFRDSNATISEIGTQLNVAYVMEGSVRTAGNQLRITAQLIEVSSEAHIWSESFTRDIDDIFGVQDEIAAAVADKLELSLAAELPGRQAIDGHAYALFLQAEFMRNQRSLESEAQSMGLYRRVLEVEPGWAPALTALALAEYELLRPHDGQRARALLEEALQNAPNFAPAFSVLGLITLMEGDHIGVAPHLQRALTLEPAEPAALGVSSLYYQTLGRSGVSLNEYIAERDPTNASVHHYLSLAYYMAGRLDEALGASRTALALSPDLYGGHWSIANVLLEKGELQGALAAIEHEPLDRHRLLAQVSIYHAMGESAKSDELLQELIDKYGEKGPYFVAWPLAYRGENELAFQYLERAVEVRDPGLYGIVGNRNFVNLHDDPRWLPLLESIGRSPEQLAAIEFEVVLPE